MMDISKLLKNKERVQTISLYLSTLIGVVLGFVASIVNTHALDAVSYGDVRYVQNLIQLISWLLLFGYFMSGSRLLAIAKNKDESANIRGVLIIILGVCCSLLMLNTLILCYMHYLQPVVAQLFLFSIPVCFYPLLTNFLNTVAQGDNYIGRLSCARLLPSLLYIPLAYFFYKTCGATSANMILLQWGIYSLVLIGIIVSMRPKFGNIKKVFKALNEENKRYGLKLYQGSIAMVATGYIGGVTLGLFNSDNVNVGFYTLALTVTMPLSYLPAVIGTTYFKKFANQSCIPPKVLTVSTLMTVGSLVLFVLLIRPMISLLYPPEYVQVGIYACWLAVGFSFHGMGDLVNRFLGSHGLGKPILVASLSCGLFKLIGFVLLVYLWGINGAIITYVFSSVIYAVVLFVYYYKLFVK